MFPATDQGVGVMDYRNLLVDLKLRPASCPTTSDCIGWGGEGEPWSTSGATQNLESQNVKNCIDYIFLI